MKKIFKIVLISLFSLFSFYYTDKIIDFSKKNDPLMIKIEKAKNVYETSPVNGIVTSNTMMVGVSGKKIDIDKSYEKMKKINQYNEELLEYINIKPSITMKDNYDKLIIGSNTLNREISFIFRFDNVSDIAQISYILDLNNTKATFFIEEDVFKNNIFHIKNLINNNISLGIYGNNIRYVKSFNKYSNYCLYKDKEFFDDCISFRINTIKPILINSNLYNYIKYNKKNGFIYEIKITKENIKELNSTLIYLKQKGYKIISLEELLKE